MAINIFIYVCILSYLTTLPITSAKFHWFNLKTLICSLGLFVCHEYPTLPLCNGLDTGMMLNIVLGSLTAWCGISLAKRSTLHRFWPLVSALLSTVLIWVWYDAAMLDRSLVLMVNVAQFWFVGLIAYAESPILEAAKRSWREVVFVACAATAMFGSTFDVYDGRREDTIGIAMFWLTNAIIVEGCKSVYVYLEDRRQQTLEVMISIQDKRVTVEFLV